MMDHDGDDNATTIATANGDSRKHQRPTTDLFAGMQDTKIDRYPSSVQNAYDLRRSNGSSSSSSGYPRFPRRPTRECVLKRLSEALMRRSLMKIDLSQRGILASDAKLVKMALLQNQQLSVLKLGYNSLGDAGVKTLVAGITSHQALRSLDLGFNQISDEGCKALAEALVCYDEAVQSQNHPNQNRKKRCCALQTLYLAGNHVGEEGALALANAIRRGCTITKLHLTGNRLGPDGVKALTEAILEDDIQRRAEETISFNDCSGRNTDRGIQELFLGGTSMGSVGCVAVAKMLARSTSIRVLSLANCGISDQEVSLIASSIKENRDLLPLQSLQLSFNSISSKGTDVLTSAIWGSKVLRELLLDNNEIGDRGAQHIANILPYVSTLEVLDVGFNSIKAHGMKALMKVVAESHHVKSLSVSGNSIDTGSAKAVAYALAYNRSLKRLYLDHCGILHEGQRHIVAGFVSNSGIALRKLTGFRIGPVIVTIEMPAALEHWTNEQVLNFIHLMWEQSNQYSEATNDDIVDPLQFLPDAPGESSKAVGPLDATTVVEVAKRAFASLGENSHDVFSKKHSSRELFNSPLAEDAIMIESDQNGERLPVLESNGMDNGRVGYEEEEDRSDTDSKLGRTVDFSSPDKPKSFVATPAEPAKSGVSDPDRKKRIVDWLCKNIQYLNELSQIPFNSGELWRLHQHYFTPVVNERGGSAVGASPLPSTETVGRIVNSVPEVSRTTGTDSSTITPSPNSSSEDHMMVPVSDPAILPPPGLPMLKRKVSYRFLGDAMLNAKSEPRADQVSVTSPNGHSVARMIEDGAGVQSMPPKTKRARRNKTRISFLPRIKAKLESYLDVCHEKALILMRQLHFVEKALLEGRINPSSVAGVGSPPIHLSGILAEEAEMILIDMV